MAKTYLSDDAVKRLQKIVKEYLPKDKIKQIRKAQEIYPGQIFNSSDTDIHKNIKAFEQWRYEQFKVQNPGDYEKVQVIRHRDGGTAYADNDVWRIYEPYTKKWEWLEAVLWTAFHTIEMKINNEYTQVYGVEKLYASELVNAEDTDRYIEEKYSAQPGTEICGLCRGEKLCTTKRKQLTC